MTRDEVIQKIKKLLRMKRGGTQGEIENALAMAAELARKHGINLDSVDPDAVADQPICAGQRFQSGEVCRLSSGTENGDSSWRRRGQSPCNATAVAAGSIALAAIEDALLQVNSLACPIMPVTDFETVAYADEEDELVCGNAVSNELMSFTAGKRYKLTTGSYKFTEKFTRNKVHFDEETQTTYTKEHDCQLSGNDRYIEVTDDNRKAIRFMDRPREETGREFPESQLWQIFRKPDVKTVAELKPAAIDTNLAVLRSCELMSNYRYYLGQGKYLSRIATKDCGLAAAATGCHEAGTPILMADGSVKKVEYVRVGDVIMGWKSPSQIMALARGVGRMYRITPTKGDSFVVNEDHILTLVRTNKGKMSRDTKQNGNVIDVSVRDWLTWPKSRKHLFKLFRVGVEWPSRPTPIDPYLMGLILGDGCFRSGYKYSSLGITTGDAEIESFIRDTAKSQGWGIRAVAGRGCKDLYLTNCDELRNALYSFGLRGIKCEERFIPDAFRVNDRHTQLQVLAGLIDSDGHFTCGGYDYVSKSKQLALGVAFIARSVGLAAYVVETNKSCQNGFSGLYHRVYISGDCSIVPCKIKRKQSAPRQQKKSVSRTGFKAEYVGIKDYYGFNIGGDGRFLMGDFTVTHNTGKTLMAISLLAMKGPERALIIAPQGTMRSSEVEDDDGEEQEEVSASQWIQEINRFAPFLQVWEIFSHSDYERILSLNGGQLPPGVYVSYYQAMFQNGAKERCPSSWDDEKLNKYGISKGLGPLEMQSNKTHWTDSVGKEVDGIRCILEPCLATLIGHHFDMVMLDEAHVCCNLGANLTQMLIRLQPKYRWALTATPIPNVVDNLFSLAGWICVDDWYKGSRRNAAWPYARHEQSRFTATFRTMERDFTQEAINKKKDPKNRGMVIRDSPMISSPARLLKLLKSWMAYISKPDVNQNYIPPEIIDVRVSMGREQSVLYGHFLDRANIDGHPLTRARKQSAWLRGICCDPMHFRHGGPKVTSNMNPKVIAILELVRDILAAGEQVVIINSRVGLSDTLQQKLVEAGVPISRIDSTIPAEQHAAQANLFKSGRARVKLMGIKCASAYSFDACANEIIGSIEYSPGPLTQAVGRIDRVTNAVKKKIYCILNKNSIEEIMFDTVALKDDAATICLKGQRVPRTFKPVDGSELLASAIEHFDLSGSTPESECEAQWPKLRKRIADALLTSAKP